MDLEFYNGKKVLITGGNGYLAYNLIKALKGNELEITRFDIKIDDWSDLNEKSNLKITNIEGDIKDKSLLESVIPNYDIIFHFAAQTSVYVADNDPVNDVNINLIPIISILDICDKKQLRPVIIFSGTATEVGLNKRILVDETATDNPVTIYDLNKHLAEEYLEYYCRKGSVKGATLRLANVYGPGPKTSSKDRGVVNMMIKRAINGLPLTLYGDGDYMRDYVFIEDVIKAFLSAAKNIDNINGGYYYIGTGKGHTILDLFRMIIERTQLVSTSKSEIKFIDPPENLSIIETRSFIADISKFLENTDWMPTIDLFEGIDLTIEYFNKNRLL